MARNGSGSYNLPTNSWNPSINGVPATAADWQALINDVASAITQSLSRDGQTAVTGNLQMAGNKLTGLGLGTASGDSLPWQQLFSQGLQQDLASASVTDIGAVNSTLVNVTGTTTITSFGTNYNGPRFLRFAGVLTLTNSITLDLPGNANITTAAGDSAIAVPLGNPATGWRVISYVREADVPGAPADKSVTFAKIQNIATSTILGRSTAGTGDVEALTGAQAAAIIGISASAIQTIGASVSANALTVSAGSTRLDFRSTTLGSGTITTVAGTPANLVVPSTATLGTINAVQSDIAVLALNNSGTLELAVVNISGGVDLSETGLISTTAISATADLASVVYSTTARTNVAYRVIGFIRSTQATAGTWATAPSLIQGQGGQALASMQSLGFGQTIQDVLGSRAIGVTYYNTTGKPIVAHVQGTSTVNTNIAMQINGTFLYGSFIPNGSTGGSSWVIPAGASYQAGGITSLNTWFEMR